MQKTIKAGICVLFRVQAHWTSGEKADHSFQCNEGPAQYFVNARECMIVSSVYQNARFHSSFSAPDGWPSGRRR
jgi:hypothetical protein